MINELPGWQQSRTKISGAFFKVHAKVFGAAHSCTITDLFSKSSLSAVPSLSLLQCTKILALSVLVIVFLASRINSAYANNVAVENVELVELDDDADTINIEFDLSWSNAWKDSVNNDAVWVFAKYRTSTASAWAHVTLKTAGTNPSGFADGTKQSGSNFSSLDILVPADKLGAFIQPANPSSGSVDFHDVQLVWDYAQDGLSDEEADGANTEIDVFAIEMVYVPEGGFYLGDGSAGTYGEFEYGPSASSKPGAITSEEAIEFQDVTGTASGLNKWYYNTDATADDVASGTTFILGEPFPKGFQAIYAMKYEMSQGQYRDFLNHLTQPQQNTRVVSDISNENDANTYVMIAEGQGTVANRQAVKAGSNPADGAVYTFSVDLDDDNTGDESNDGEWIAMNYLSWMDLAAYADWAALRPMTELEFEKLCRGTTYPVDEEYAWGTTDLTGTTSISNSGQTSEVAGQTGNGLANYNNAVGGPLRVGSSATASTTIRKQAGASFYGILNLSGNVWEHVVTVGNTAGRSFAGTHGDGVLTTTSSYEGNATNVDWPGIDSTSDARGVTGATGSGFRGSAWDETTTRYLQVSNREYAGDDDNTRRSDTGGRLVRTA